MSVNLDRSIVVANLGKQQLTDSAGKWIAETFPESRRALMEWGRMDVPSFRNRVVRDIVLMHPEQPEWVLWIDNDVTITHPGLEHFLGLHGDLISCECRQASGDGAWRSPGAFHLTFAAVRVEVYRKLPPPWFAFEYSADGCDMLDCECGHFAKRAAAAGYTIAHGGHCGHGCNGTWCR